MGYLKKFTDVGAGIAAAHGAVYLIREFMMFKPEDVESSSEKLKLFLSVESKRDYRSLMFLVAVLFLSALAGLILRKLYPVPMVTSLVSFTFVMYLFEESKLYDRPMLFVLLGALHVIGNYADALQRDRRDGKHRARLLANLTHLYAIFFCAYILIREKKIAEIPTTEMKPFDVDIYLAVRMEEPLSLFLVLAAICVGCILISLLLKDLYFIDAILSLIPLGCTLFWWYTEKVSVGLSLLLGVLVMATVARIVLMLASPSDRDMKERWQKEEEAKNEIESEQS